LTEILTKIKLVGNLRQAGHDEILGIFRIFSNYQEISVKQAVMKFLDLSWPAWRKFENILKMSGNHRNCVMACLTQNTWNLRVVTACLTGACSSPSRL
jgi:hypothetical protein